MEPKFITVQEASDRAQVDPQTIYRWLRNGMLTRYKIGVGRGYTRVNAEELETLLTPTPAVPADR